MRTLAALAAAAMLAGPFCLPAQAGNREEPASTPPPAQAPSPQASPQTSPQTSPQASPQTSPQTEAPPQEPAQAGDWETLWTWIGENRNEGGTIRLTGDVTVPAGTRCEFMDVWTQTVVDCGDFTIYVDGSLTVDMAPQLTFQGTGGENGLLHVRKGGYLALAVVNVTADDPSATALVQEEESQLWAVPGGVFMNRQINLTGQISYADLPVLVEPETGMGEKYLVVVPDGQTLADCTLPGTAQASLLLGGAIQEVRPGEKFFSKVVDQSVEWQLEEQSTALSERKRAVIPGRFVGGLTVEGYGTAYLQAYTPMMTVAFQVDGAALTDCLVETGRGGRRTLVLNFLFDPAPAKFRLLSSTDQGEHWAQIGDDKYSQEQSGWIIREEVTGQMENAWFLVEAEYPDPTPENPKQVRLVHTDVVALENMQVVFKDYRDGNRGGGEQIVTPPVTPPTVLPPDGFYGGQEQTPPTPSAPQEPEGPSGESARPEEPQVPQEPEETPPSQLGESDQTETPGVHTGQTAPPVEGEDPAEDPPPQETAPVDGPASGGPVSNGAASRDPSSAQAAAETTLPEGEPPAAEPSPGPGQDTEHGTAAQEDPTHSGASAESGQPEPAASDPAEADGETAPSAPAEGTEKEADGETASGLSPAAQIAVGLAAVAAVAAGAVAALNPGLVRRLFRRGKPRS